MFVRWNCETNRKRKKKGGDEICVNAKCAEKKVVGWKPITKSLGVLWFVGTAGQSYTTKTA